MSSREFLGSAVCKKMIYAKVNNDVTERLGVGWWVVGVVDRN